MLADADTPKANRLEQVFVVLPPEARAWALSQGIAQPPQVLDGLVKSNSAALRFLSPDPYSVFQLNERIPAASQRLRFAVTAPATTRTVEFRLNDELIGSVERGPWELWWTLAPGEYQLAAATKLADGAIGESRSLTFSVLEESALESYERSS